MTQLISGELQIEAHTVSPTMYRVEWKGRSSNRYPGTELNPFLGAVLDKANQSRGSIEMHFEALEYFNSSTVAVLVEFIRNACAERVPVKFTYAADVRWQRLSFDALQVFCLIDHNVEVTPISRS